MGNRNTIGIYSRIPCCEKLVLLLLKEDYMRMRNCAYGFAVDWFGATINPDNVVVIDDYKAGEFERNILVTRDLKYWKIYNSMRILNTNYRWKIYLGWKFYNVKSIHRAMLAFRIWVCKAN